WPSRDELLRLRSRLYELELTNNRRPRTPLGPESKPQTRPSHVFATVKRFRCGVANAGNPEEQYSLELFGVGPLFDKTKSENWRKYEEGAIGRWSAIVRSMNVLVFL